MAGSKGLPARGGSAPGAAQVPQQLTLADATCPICLGIMVEPVGMPCSHRLCMACFQQHVRMASLQCPLCRKRISIWCRKATRERTLVDQDLWGRIREGFPNLVQARVDGVEPPADGDGGSRPPVSHQMSGPGEIGKEFQDQMEKMQIELRIDQEAQDVASLHYISSLKKEKLELLQEQLKVEVNGNYETPPCNGHNGFHRADATPPASPVASTSSAPARRPNRRSSTSPDSLRGELTHFRPIQSAPLTPPRKLPNGKVEEPTLIRARPLSFASPESPSVPLLAPVASISLAAENGSSPFVSATPKHAGGGDEEPSTSRPPPKRTRTEPSTSSATPALVPLRRVLDLPRPVLDESIMEGQRLLEKRIRQEQEDFKLALQLQRELNKGPTIKVDRRRGSGSEYNLRNRPQ